MDASPAISVGKLSILVLASFGAAAYIRYYSVREGTSRVWHLAPYAGMAGAFLTVALFCQGASLGIRLASATLVAVLYGALDYVIYQGLSFESERQHYIESVEVADV